MKNKSIHRYFYVQGVMALSFELEGNVIKANVSTDTQVVELAFKRKALNGGSVSQKEFIPAFTNSLWNSLVERDPRIIVSKEFFAMAFSKFVEGI